MYVSLWEDSQWKNFYFYLQATSFESYDETTKTLLLAIPNKQLYEKLESSYIETLSIVLQKFFGKGVELLYRIQQA